MTGQKEYPKIISVDMAKYVCQFFQMKQLSNTPLAYRVFLTNLALDTHIAKYISERFKYKSKCQHTLF